MKNRIKPKKKKGSLLRKVGRKNINGMAKYECRRDLSRGQGGHIN